MYDTYLLYLLTFGYCWNGSFAIPMFFLLFVTQPHGVVNYHNIMAIIYFKRLCIFGPKGAIQIRYYYLLLLSRGDYLSFFLVLSRMRLAVWLSGNALVSINVVTLRRARLVPGWATVFRRVNYLRM